MDRAGPPMLAGAYNNNYQIVQTPGYVMILVEMIHDVRIIPLDGRPHAAAERPPVDGKLRAATGKATRWSSRRRISTARSRSRDPARTCA